MKRPASAVRSLWLPFRINSLQDVVESIRSSEALLISYKLFRFNDLLDWRIDGREKAGVAHWSRNLLIQKSLNGPQIAAPITGTAGTKAIYRDIEIYIGLQLVRRSEEREH